MVFVPLNVTPCYRAWRMGGVHHVLMSPEAVRNVAALIRTTPKYLTPVSAPASQPKPIAQISANTFATPALDIQETAMPSRDRRLASHETHHSPSEKAILPEDFTPASKLSYERWPNPWQQRLAASASKPLVVWSYVALCQDFGGQSDATRTAMIREIYAGMGLRKGSHVLWPLQLITDTTPRPDIFREAMTVLQPRVLVLLYDKVPDGLGIAPLTCYQSAYPASLLGLTVVLGPTMETLVSNVSALSPLLHIVQQLLGVLPEGARVR